MMRWIFISVIIVAVIAVVWMLGLWEEGAPVDEPRSITVLWAEWEPAVCLRELVKDFTRETGIQVTIITAPWDRFQDVFFQEMEQKGEQFDLVVGDSQWLGKSVFNGYYVELSQWMSENRIFDVMTPASIEGYANYPRGSDHYWAIPCMGDAFGVAYRKDLFEDSAEQQAFLNRFGYPLAVPETWSQLRDIAEFFHRPAQDLYGISLTVGAQYDALTMLVDMFVWAWGASLGDYRTYHVKNILDSPAGVQALEFVKSLVAFCPPGSENAFHSDVVDTFQQGRTAMAITFFAFFMPLLHEDMNPYAHATGFFSAPKGPQAQVTSLGGQGLSIVSYSKKKALAFKFLAWFTQAQVQKKWAELGGFACYAPLLDSQEFLDAKPYNKAFRESMNSMRDFWNLPEYGEMLAVSQRYWYEYLHDGLSAQDVMSDIASAWEQILENAGYYKE